MNRITTNNPTNNTTNNQANNPNHSHDSANFANAGRHAFRVWLRLGRVSNLPTVWSNVLAGAVLVGSMLARPVSVAHIGWLMLIISLFYCGGMVLNDAFDREIDARERPGRPIPSGQVSVRAVFCVGFLLEALGIALLSQYGVAAMCLGAALAGGILLYNVWHKGNPFSPLVMGACRALVYFVAASATLHSLGGQLVLPPLLPLLCAAAALWAHVAGLTYAAKQENLNRLGSIWPLLVLALPFGLVWLGFSANPMLWPALMMAALVLADILAVRLLIARATPTAVPHAVAQLIAAISLLDGVVIAAAGGAWYWLLFCLWAYLGTRVFQRIVPGT